ncbi:hydroxymethylpyrimidine/phosphomethylpyrimidine kinase [Serpentinimonas maccroryi]|uniref:hydroxymethylpyrimidine kinase n=1 Tax=Serpentinimonas maccroryi TaxID=1458426 RepID=A0A060NVB1_9BURK|nr:bifunctional hydroxymethylpyrimidine kinase/phosphomethylpyrimidine kinase [Serpentinimonas maccroryi]BAO83483.1 hydroxymethylpyrimidine/phosphomethylpyrimidine kinase [Serpentinimonas maccroryi]
MLPDPDHPAQPAQPSSHSWRYARVLTIAGSDSGGGAGIQADLKTFAALGCYGMSAITALTAQNTLGVRAIHAVPASFLEQQMAAVFEDIGVDAVKIGMLHAPDVVRVVARALDRYAPPWVVLDPVMVATSGDALIEPETVALLRTELFPRASLVTPNLDEAALLLGRPVADEAALDAAAADLLALGARAVLLKGGHLQGAQLTDVLACAGTPPAAWLRLRGPRIASRNIHGTGCTLAAAIAAQLALGQPLPLAVQAAHAWVRAAIEAGAGARIGSGHGPLNHGFAPQVLRRVGS